jgi:hypothetical protein
MNKIKITTNLPIEDAVSKLSREIVSSSGLWISREGLVGKVTPTKVSLYRGVPLQGNSFLPVLAGTFETENGQTVLKGKWTYHWLPKIAATLIIGGLLIDLVLKIMQKSPQVVSSVLIFLGVLFGIWISSLIGRKMASGDKKWITQYVQHILNS